MKEETVQKLENLIDQTKIYNGKKITFYSYQEVGATIVIKTDSRPFNLLPSEIDSFIENLKDVQPPKSVLPTIKSDYSVVTVNGYQPSADNIIMKSTLMNVLNELKTDSSEKIVTKARSMCDIANTIVNIQKAEIQLINAVKR